MTNLYDFLRGIYEDANKSTESYDSSREKTVKIRREDIPWIEQYLAGPDHEIHFKARAIGEERGGEPVFAMDFGIKGTGVEIFQLLTEVMLQNATFADLVVKAGLFFRDHVPTCPACQAELKKVANNQTSWELKPHANE